MLNKEEFLRLQKLAAISLDDKETVKLWKQLETIVEFLGNLKNISWNESNYSSNSNILNPIEGVSEYEDVETLFINTKHEKIWNSIVVNSVVDN